MPKIENKILNLLFRADASVRGGTGHVMRCLALAQACEARGGSAQFILAQSTPPLESRLRGAGISVARVDFDAGSPVDARETIRQARAEGSSWIVADGYDFGSAWQKEIKASQFRLLLLDDYGHAKHYSADIVLNQNLHAQEAAYASREPFTRLLLGPRFSLLRDEFVKGRKAERRIPDRARKILVTLGGSDPDNITHEVIEVLATVHDIEVTVVVGGSNPHLHALRRLVEELPATVALMADANNMPDQMAWADVAIAAGGTTSWELAFTGLPSVVITLADNQEAICAELDRAGLAISIGRWDGGARARLIGALAQLLSDIRRRQKMSDTGRQLVDGRGRERVLETLAADCFESA
jgi:UDP-2,4-diacetamido-2,4,6-trideoxy-beta-L-altropyranose hydrolase